jgi:hypothetical protein
MAAVQPAEIAVHALVRASEVFLDCFHRMYFGVQVSTPALQFLL